MNPKTYAFGKVPFQSSIQTRNSKPIEQMSTSTKFPCHFQCWQVAAHFLCQKADTFLVDQSLQGMSREPPWVSEKINLEMASRAVVNQNIVALESEDPLDVIKSKASHGIQSFGLRDLP